MTRQDLIAVPVPAQPSRRPRGERRGRAPDPDLEVRFDPRLELAEHLLHRALEGPADAGPALLRQVRNLLDDAQHDQRGELPALLTLDRLLLTLTGDPAPHRRARRIMEARQLLHRVRESRPEESRLRRLAGILTSLEQRPA